MRYSSVSKNLAFLGGAKWEVHELARALAAKGEDIIELTIGEPDIPTPHKLIEKAYFSMRKGRTGYSSGRGEKKLLDTLSERYSRRVNRPIGTDQILCFPGTQTALYAVMRVIAEAGDEVLVGDPMYATYAGVIAASGATAVPVPLRSENGFRIQAADLSERITSRTRVILINTPHNPTGAVLTADDIDAIGKLAKQYDLWLLVDEVYEELVFSTARFISPLEYEKYADRVIVASSISKSHAAPGFRSGWCVGPVEFCHRLLPLSETMLFGNQPFIADMTALAVSEPSEVAPGMVHRYEKRAKMLYRQLHEQTNYSVHRPDAGMFALIDVSASGLSGYDYAMDLLKTQGVAVMPGSAFGESLIDWVRLALPVDDAAFFEACSRIIAHSRTVNKDSA